MFTYYLISLKTFYYLKTSECITTKLHTHVLKFEICLQKVIRNFRNSLRNGVYFFSFKLKYINKSCLLPINAFFLYLFIRTNVENVRFETICFVLLYIWRGSREKLLLNVLNAWTTRVYGLVVWKTSLVVRPIIIPTFLHVPTTMLGILNINICIRPF